MYLQSVVIPGIPGFVSEYDARVWPQEVDRFSLIFGDPSKLTNAQLDRQIAICKFFSRFDFFGLLEGRLERLEKVDSGRYFHCVVL